MLIQTIHPNLAPQMAKGTPNTLEEYVQQKFSTRVLINLFSNALHIIAVRCRHATNGLRRLLILPLK